MATIGSINQNFPLRREGTKMCKGFVISCVLVYSKVFI